MPDYLAIARPGEVWGETGPQARQLQSPLGGKRVGPVQESLAGAGGLAEVEMQGEVGGEVARTARDTIRQMNTQIEQEILGEGEARRGWN